MEKVIHIIPWSGGPDSTYQLKKVLEETNDQVVTISGTMLSPAISKTSRLSEEKARDQSEPLLQNIRSFDRIDIGTDEPHEPHSDFSQITTLVYYICYLYKPDRGYNYYCRCKDDTTRPPGALISTDKIKATMENMRTPIEQLYNIKSVTVNLDVTKREIYEYLGQELWDLSFSCYKPPTVGVPCGECVKCDERRIAEFGS